jgi:hypothetical protein
VLFDMTMLRDRYATLLEMQDWAKESRPPDFRIGPGYIDRWFITPRSEAGNVYLHRTLRSDDDRALHDHPWDNTSFIIAGGFTEVVPDRFGGEMRWKREPGEVIQRKATDRHRLELEPGYQSISLFMTGPKVREWGFWCGGRFVHWREFVGADRGTVGRGCG